MAQEEGRLRTSAVSSPVPAENVVRVPKTHSEAASDRHGERHVELRIHLLPGSDDESSYAARE